MGVASFDLDPADRPDQPDPSSVPVKPKLARLKVRFRFRENQDPDLATKVVRAPSARRAAAVARVVGDRSFRTFLAEWDPKIGRTIERLRMGEHVEDIKQEIYLFMSRRDPETGKNGLEAYDPAKASFSSYVYHLVTLKTLNYRNKLSRDRLALSPKGKDPELQGDRKSVKPWERAEFWLQLERLAEEHDARAEGGFFDKKGRLVTRDPKTVVELLLVGLTREEIARRLRCKVEVIDRIILVLRDDAEVRALLSITNDEPER